MIVGVVNCLSKSAIAGAFVGVGIGVLIGLQLRKNKQRRNGRMLFEEKVLSKEQVWQMRTKLFCQAQSVSYSNSDPLMIVQGKGQYLYDENGVEYLDSRNNVGHVGWQNESVVGAVERQLEKCNSNTRYLHPNPVMLAEKLVATMPEKLCKVFLVNSGSEANDLAIRLAREFTNGRDCIVVDRAYHGHTSTVLDISPYKFQGNGGKGKPDWVHVIPCPDPYREGYDQNSVDKFVGHVQDACEDVKRRDQKLAAFFIESGMSVAGVILPPEGYLNKIYEAVRREGGVCVADEVQVGFGRYGDYYWGFQQLGVVPDIVTMGKPFGNGFPLAAVVCTQEIANAFENGMEYFNTFGGNPVACAAGLAVMETVEKDGLREHASAVGSYFKSKLVDLMNQEHGRLIGDIRGSGLFLGIEFVRDKKTKEPATEEVSIILTRLLREYKILASCDGTYYNVIVIKPPMVFNQSNADTFMSALEHILQTMGVVDPTKVRLTPT
uniref:Uncharacterized protein n=1 Tax=Mucochytrium quahogii TaxID=96639 RepID=A0A7S2S0Z9_9STRA|mmetsp:Transcript_2303/g.4481  ORF Transcript_2303/g.4481 Transcript_2303/m.4481 type:complete len:493 (+) Transcript_2303:228-1706(+)|eukprot:CAMPEP_0203748282 /NCGR_PEP_ID=MMETSP0098-20131031/3209_1 /ASSEMBLY_ACC=CAM_ASM_000208 /TAXON_ID=96639 /ORGANISM=" , Strain NY0313808BC1" /LENGTH=492 /DNA_ID=CAMNT_0050636979 /DNA_START=173 /DNA_END=1651 /DNA_ORIENTATION=-